MSVASVYMELLECSPSAIADASLDNGNARSPPISLHHTIAHTHERKRSNANSIECVLLGNYFVTWSELCTLCPCKHTIASGKMLKSIGIICNQSSIKLKVTFFTRIYTWSIMCHNKKNY